MAKKVINMLSMDGLNILGLESRNIEMKLNKKCVEDCDGADDKESDLS